MIPMIEVVVRSCFLFTEANHIYGALLFSIEHIYMYILQYGWIVI